MNTSYQILLVQKTISMMLTSTSVNNCYINVPDTVLIYAAQNNLHNALRLFLWLKMIHRDGRIHLSISEKILFANLIGYKDTRPVDYNLKKLMEMKWISYQACTKQHRLKSFKNIMNKLEHRSKRKTPVYFGELNELLPKIGYAVYKKLFKNFKWKIKHGGGARLKGRAFIPLPSSTIGKRLYAPISIIVVEKFLGISRSKASILKSAAASKKLIHVLPNSYFTTIPIEQIELYRKYSPKGNRLYFKDNKVLFRSVDLIHVYT